MSATKTKPTAPFWVIGILALIWNLLGVSAYLLQAFMTPEMISQLPEEQQAELLVEHPAWYTALFALAVFGGALASLLLLLRKRASFYFYALSGVCAIVQQIYLFINVELTSIIMPIMIIVFCLFLIWYSKKCADDGIIN